MSRHNVTDPDAYVSCPFNDTHQIPASRLQRHIMKCEKQHLHLDLQHCPFNYCHLAKKSEMRHHMANCPDKALVERDILARENNDQVDENRKMGYFTKIEYKDDWADDDAKFEDWDNESETSSRAAAPTAYDRVQPKPRLPRSQPKALQQQHVHQRPVFLSQSLATSGVGRGRAAKLGYGATQKAPSQASSAKPLQNGFHEQNSLVTQSSPFENTDSRNSALTAASSGSSSDSFSSSELNEIPNKRSNGFLGRGHARGRSNFGLSGSAATAQPPAPKVGMAANFDSNAQSLLVTAGRGRGRGRLPVSADAPSTADDQRKKELRKWQKKKREVEELEARQQNGGKLSQNEQEKLERKEYILQRLQSLSLNNH